MAETLAKMVVGTRMRSGGEGGGEGEGGGGECGGGGEGSGEGGDHVVERLVEELVQRLAGLGRRINSDLVQHGEGVGANQRRLGTSTLYLEGAAATRA